MNFQEISKAVAAGNGVVNSEYYPNGCYWSYISKDKELSALSKSQFEGLVKLYNLTEVSKIHEYDGVITTFKKI